MADEEADLEFLRKIPGITPEIIELMPSWYSKAIKTNLNSFFVTHKLAKESIKRCSFEHGVLLFGEAQQSKGKALQLIDDVYRNKLISSEDANAIIDYVHKFNDAKTRDFLESIKICEKKEAI